MNTVTGDLTWEDLEAIDGIRGLTQLLNRQQKKFTVSVEGNIGCGKSTLLDHFQKFKNTVETIKEPVDKWTDIRGHNGLQYIYEDPTRWNFSFNYYAMLTRTAMHTQKVKVPVKMLERSLFSTKHVFVENCRRLGTLAEVECSILSEWFDFIVGSQDVKVDLFVYLRADPDVCYNRLRKRDRKEEASVPREFIEALHDLHEEWLMKPDPRKLPAPVLVLDANHELPQMEAIYEEYRSQILFGCS